MKKITLLALMFLSFNVARAQMIEGFENWHTYFSGALNVPNGWNATDSLIKFFGLATNPGATFLAQAEKELPGNGSATAMRLMTKIQPALTGIIPGGPMPCMASNSVIQVNTGTGEFTFTGGLPFNYDPVSASCWVKNDPRMGDSTSITFLAIDNSDGGDSIVAVADTMLGASLNNFTQITMPFKYNNSGFTTTLLRVIIASSGNFYFDVNGAFAGLNDSSSIIVDNISVAAPSGIITPILSSTLANVYPTQVTDKLYIDMIAPVEKGMECRIFDLKGGSVFQSSLSQNQSVFDLSTLPSGNYIFGLYTDGRMKQSGKISKY
ncbi:MAG: T9SS type A sorting domain-containing protein [Chitinophagaceae bacterium]|nr:T9SS type A sorting domain-containing protein [Chitinophagaceae bacterium]